MRVLLFSLLMFASSFAFASYSRSELISQYNGCKIFLKLSPAKQKVVAKSTRYSLGQALWACKRNTGLSLKAYLHKYENKRLPGEAPDSGYSSSSGKGLRCAWTAECPGIGMYNCIGGTCRLTAGSGIGGFTCDSAHSCAAGETCMSGICTK